MVLKLCCDASLWRHKMQKPLTVYCGASSIYAKKQQLAVDVCHLGGVQPVLKCIQGKDKDTRRNGCAVLSVLAATALGLEQMRSCSAIPPVIACVRDNDVRTRRDAVSSLAALCENESDHNLVIQAGGLKAISIGLDSKDVETQKWSLRCIKLLAFNSQVHKAVKDGSLGIIESISRCALDSNDPELVIVAKDVQAAISMSA